MVRLASGAKVVVSERRHLPIVRVVLRRRQISDESRRDELSASLLHLVRVEIEPKTLFDLALDREQSLLLHISKGAQDPCIQRVAGGCRRQGHYFLLSSPQLLDHISPVVEVLLA